MIEGTCMCHTFLFHNVILFLRPMLYGRYVHFVDEGKETQMDPI